MRKILVLLVIIGLFVSCTASIQILDEDGFRLFSYHQFLTGDNICVQSHDGYKVEGKLYNENVFTLPVSIENVVDKSISVKITTEKEQKWVEIGALQTLYIPE